MTFHPTPPLPPYNNLFAGWSVQFFGCPVIAFMTYNLTDSLLIVGYNDESLDIFEGVQQGVGQALPVLKCGETYFNQAIVGNYVKALTQLALDNPAGADVVLLAAPGGFNYGATFQISLDDHTTLTTTISRPPASLSASWVMLDTPLPSPASSGNLVALTVAAPASASTGPYPVPYQSLSSGGSMTVQ